MRENWVSLASECSYESIEKVVHSRFKSSSLNAEGEDSSGAGVVWSINIAGKKILNYRVLCSNNTYHLEELDEDDKLERLIVEFFDLYERTKKQIHKASNYYKTAGMSEVGSGIDIPEPDPKEKEDDIK